MVEIIVEYKITNNGSRPQSFQVAVLPEVANDGTLLTADDGTTITSGIYASEVDNIEGLTINQDGALSLIQLIQHIIFPLEMYKRLISPMR